MCECGVLSVHICLDIYIYIATLSTFMSICPGAWTDFWYTVFFVLSRLVNRLVGRVVAFRIGAYLDRQSVRTNGYIY